MFPERIVYVDDEQALRDLVRRSLEYGGFEGALVTCGSGKEFFDRLRELQPELLLLDLKMPDMNGVDILERLNAENVGEKIPVVILTGETQVAMQEYYQNLGVIGVIHKPFDLKTFAQVLGEMLGAGPPDESVS